MKDPLYDSSRREMWAILIIWLCFGVWVIGCYQSQAFQVDAKTLKTVFGIPSWVFWGVAVPWLAATTVTIIFSMGIMKDHPLDEIGKADG